MRQLKCDWPTALYPECQTGLLCCALCVRLAYYAGLLVPGLVAVLYLYCQISLLLLRCIFHVRSAYSYSVPLPSVWFTLLYLVRQIDAQDCTFRG